MYNMSKTSVQNLLSSVFFNSLQKTGLLWYFWSQGICTICCFSCDCASEKTKSRLQKWGFVPFSKKGKCATKGIMEGAPLTQEGICQVYQLIEFLSKEQSNAHVNHCIVSALCEHAYVFMCQQKWAEYRIQALPAVHQHHFT